MGGQKEWGSQTHSFWGILILKTKEEIKININHLLYYKEPKHLGKKWTSTVDCGLLKPMNKNVRACLKMQWLLQKWFHKILPASLPATMWQLLPCIRLLPSRAPCAWRWFHRSILVNCLDNSPWKPHTCGLVCTDHTCHPPGFLHFHGFFSFVFFFFF